MTYRKIPILPFLYIPFNGLEAMTEVFPRRAIKLLVEHQVLNEQIAENLLSWWHSGFSIDYANWNLGGLLPTIAT